MHKEGGADDLYTRHAIGHHIVDAWSLESRLYTSKLIRE